jgi:hypothetical protein
VELLPEPLPHPLNSAMATVAPARTLETVMCPRCPSASLGTSPNGGLWAAQFGGRRRGRPCVR